MHTYNRVILYTTLCICVVCTLCILRPSQAAKRGVAVTGNAIIKALMSGDYEKLDSYTSSTGIRVVQRTWDPDQSSNSEIHKPYSDGKARFDSRGFTNYLSLDSSSQTVWTERETWILSPAPMDRQWMSICQQLRGLVRNTRASYPESAVVSYNRHDEFDERQLGPCISGKVASNVYWYIYLDRENGKWKIWRIEYWQH